MQKPNTRALHAWKSLQQSSIRFCAESIMYTGFYLLGRKVLPQTQNLPPKNFKIKNYSKCIKGQYIYLLLAQIQAVGIYWGAQEQNLLIQQLCMGYTVVVHVMDRFLVRQGPSSLLSPQTKISRWNPGTHECKVTINTHINCISQ